MVFSWGNDTKKKGLLALGENIYLVKTPKLNTFLSSVRITHISLSETHGAAIDRAKCLYTWGDGSYGQLGEVIDGICPKPKKVMMNVPLFAGRVECGKNFTVGINEKNVAFCFGGLKKSLCYKNNDNNNINTNEKCITFLYLDNGNKAEEIFCGENIFAIVSQKGELYIYNEAQGLFKIILGGNNANTSPNSEHFISSVKFIDKNFYASTSSNDVLYEFVNYSGYNKPFDVYNYVENQYTMKQSYGLTLLHMPYYVKVLFFTLHCSVDEKEKFENHELKLFHKKRYKSYNNDNNITVMNESKINDYSVYSNTNTNNNWNITGSSRVSRISTMLGNIFDRKIDTIISNHKISYENSKNSFFLGKKKIDLIKIEFENQMEYIVEEGESLSEYANGNEESKREYYKKERDYREKTLYFMHNESLEEIDEQEEENNNYFSNAGLIGTKNPNIIDNFPVRKFHLMNNETNEDDYEVQNTINHIEKTRSKSSSKGLTIKSGKMLSTTMNEVTQNYSVKNITNDNSGTEAFPINKSRQYKKNYKQEQNNTISSNFISGKGNYIQNSNVIKKNYEIDDITKKIDSLIQKQKEQSSKQLINLKEISSNSDTNLKVVKQKEIEHSNTNVMLQKVKEEIQRQKEINEKEGKKFEEYENEKKKSIYTIHNNLLNNNRSQQTITGKLSNILQINHNKDENDKKYINIQKQNDEYNKTNNNSQNIVDPNKNGIQNNFNNSNEIGKTNVTAKISQKRTINEKFVDNKDAKQNILNDNKVDNNQEAKTLAMNIRKNNNQNQNLSNTEIKNEIKIEKFEYVNSNLESQLSEEEIKNLNKIIKKKENFENENNEKFEIMTPEGFNANENQEANMISRSQKNIDEKRSGINNEVFVNKKSAHSILDDSLKNGLDKQTTNKQKESISKTLLEKKKKEKKEFQIESSNIYQQNSNEMIPVEKGKLTKIVNTNIVDVKSQDSNKLLSNIEITSTNLIMNQQMKDKVNNENQANNILLQNEKYSSNKVNSSIQNEKYSDKELQKKLQEEKKIESKESTINNPHSIIENKTIAKTEKKIENNTIFQNTKVKSEAMEINPKETVQKCKTISYSGKNQTYENEKPQEPKNVIQNNTDKNSNFSQGKQTNVTISKNSQNIQNKELFNTEEDDNEIVISKNRVNKEDNDGNMNEIVQSIIHKYEFKQKKKETDESKENKKKDESKEDQKDNKENNALNLQNKGEIKELTKNCDGQILLEKQEELANLKSQKSSTSDVEFNKNIDITHEEQNFQKKPKSIIDKEIVENLEKKGEVKNEEKNNSFYRQQKNLSNYLTSKEEKVKIENQSNIKNELMDQEHKIQNNINDQDNDMYQKSNTENILIKVKETQKDIVDKQHNSEEGHTKKEELIPEHNTNILVENQPSSNKSNTNLSRTNPSQNLEQLTIKSSDSETLKDIITEISKPQPQNKSSLLRPNIIRALEKKNERLQRQKPPTIKNISINTETPPLSGNPKPQNNNSSTINTIKKINVTSNKEESIPENSFTKVQNQNNGENIINKDKRDSTPTMTQKFKSKSKIKLADTNVYASSGIEKMITSSNAMKHINKIDTSSSAKKIEFEPKELDDNLLSSINPQNSKENPDVSTNPFVVNEKNDRLTLNDLQTCDNNNNNNKIDINKTQEMPKQIPKQKTHKVIKIESKEQLLKYLEKEGDGNDEDTSVFYLIEGDLNNLTDIQEEEESLIDSQSNRNKNSQIIKVKNRKVISVESTKKNQKISNDSLDAIVSGEMEKQDEHFETENRIEDGFHDKVVVSERNAKTNLIKHKSQNVFGNKIKNQQANNNNNNKRYMKSNTISSASAKEAKSKTFYSKQATKKKLNNKKMNIIEQIKHQSTINAMMNDEKNISFDNKIVDQLEENYSKTQVNFNTKQKISKQNYQIKLSPQQKSQKNKLNNQTPHFSAQNSVPVSHRTKPNNLTQRFTSEAENSYRVLKNHYDAFLKQKYKIAPTQTVTFPGEGDEKFLRDLAMNVVPIEQNDFLNLNCSETMREFIIQSVENFKMNQVKEKLKGKGERDIDPTRSNLFGLIEPEYEDKDKSNMLEPMELDKSWIGINFRKSFVDSLRNSNSEATLPMINIRNSDASLKYFKSPINIISEMKKEEEMSPFKPNKNKNDDGH